MEGAITADYLKRKLGAKNLYEGFKNYNFSIEVDKTGYL